MFSVFLVIAAVIGFACAYYLIMTPMERCEFFLTRQLAKKLFPSLDQDQQQQRLVFYAGTILATLLCATITYFFVKHLGRG